MRKSTLSDGGPFFWKAISGPGDAGFESSTKGSLGSTRVDQTSRKAFRASRFLTTTWTGPVGAGKRSDSFSVRKRSFASAVVSHSPNTEANPREYTTRLVARSRTSKRYLPRL